MRILGIISIILGTLTAVGACLVYVWLNALACGFRTSPGPCPLKLDWEVIQLVMIPGGVAALLLILLGRYLMRKGGKG